MAEHTDQEPIQTNGPATRTKFSEAELEANFREIVSDWAYGRGELTFEEVEPYRGQHIAIYQRKIVGHGPSRSALRAEVAQRENIPEGRVVVIFIEDDKSLCL